MGEALSDNDMGDLRHLCAVYFGHPEIHFPAFFVSQWEQDVEDPTKCPLELANGPTKVRLEDADWCGIEETHWLEALCTMANAVPHLLKRIDELEEDVNGEE